MEIQTIFYLAKRWIEQRQRDEKARRDKEGIKWKQQFFKKDGDGWQYKYALNINDRNEDI